jgi:hypothetical protein
MAPFTGGYCSQHIGECPQTGGMACPGSVCINPGITATGGWDYCLKSCNVDGDCRVAEGYKCCPWQRAGVTYGVCDTTCP